MQEASTDKCPDSLSLIQSLTTVELAGELATRFDSLIIIGTQSINQNSNTFNLFDQYKGSVLSRKGLVDFLVDTTQLEYEELFADIEYTTEDSDGKET